MSKIKATEEEWAGAYALLFGSYQYSEWKDGEEAFLEKMAKDLGLPGIHEAAQEIVRILGCVKSGEYIPPSSTLDLRYL